MINVCKEKLKGTQMKAKEHRKNHLDRLASQYASQHNVSMQRTITELIAHAESRGMFRTLRNYSKRHTHSNLRQVWHWKREISI